MKNNFENIEDIIAKFLAGEATPEEIQILEEWKAAHPDNAQEFRQMSSLFTESTGLKQALSVDTDTAWLKVQLAMQPGEDKVIPIHRRNNLQAFLRIAAVLVLTVLLGTVAYFMFRPLAEPNVEIASQDNTQKTVLPDGSEIVLNKHSSIHYTSHGFSKKRIVKLNGEAFFEVKHDENIPFLVETGTLKIQDVGTSFNVKALPNSGIVIVSVVSGEVKMFTAEDKSLLLSAGEEASYNLKTKELLKSEAIDRNCAAYKDKIFIFENTELAHVVKTLNDIYGSHLVVGNEKISACRITATFNNEKVEDIAGVIAETLGLTLQKENGTISFLGNACN